MAIVKPIERHEYFSNYREKNKERIRAWREANADKIKASKKADYERNKEKYKARAKSYRLQHLDKIKAERSTREYKDKKNAKCREKYAQQQIGIVKRRRLTDEEKRQKKKDEYALNIERYRAHGKRYYQSHKEKWKDLWLKKEYWERKFCGGMFKARKKNAEIRDIESIKEFFRQVFTQDFAVCQYCRGVFRIDKITIDHKHPYKLGGRHEVSNFAVSCLVCNVKKGATPFDSWTACNK